jgi:hypothetical protein
MLMNKAKALFGAVKTMHGKKPLTQRIAFDTTS